MSNYRSFLGSKPSAQNHQPPRKPRMSTLVIGALTAISVLLGALSGGLGGALIVLALAAAATGLYVLVTGRRSWAFLPAKRKSGAIALAVSCALMIAGGLTVNPADRVELESAAAAAAAADSGPSATPTPSTPTSAGATPSSTPSPTDSGAPLDPETSAALAQGVTAVAPNTQPAFATKAVDLLALLPIKGRAPKTGYDRANFGQAWMDVDRNGCDTRNDILKRDLTDIVFANSVPCKVASGTLADPYTATTISFLRGQSTSTAVQIDHVVALSDAWQKGAQQLNEEQRTAFANDPLNLQAADGPTNMKKGDGDAATWLPPNKGYRCEYVARQISVKATYSLWVTQAEHDAMAGILADCEGQLVPTDQVAPVPATAEPAPAPAPEPAPAPAPAPEPAPAPAVVPAAPAPAPAPAPEPAPAAPAAVYFQNCTAARAAGAAPLYAGQAGYRAEMDRDKDGVACE
ncbi:DUF1524 domain-containing protein [Pseudarthrobacter sp. PS3-L1]|nr:DUF1524 domain-containing protein [Pseudarthrobacter sp. PS3-L1]MDJ0319484.1 DUF1524 domain-containing protein [Pseudarthrobacter sp. PS3-L1]